jgi:hypothetical protein
MAPRALDYKDTDNVIEICGRHVATKFLENKNLEITSVQLEAYLKDTLFLQKSDLTKDYLDCFLRKSNVLPDYINNVVLGNVKRNTLSDFIKNNVNNNALSIFARLLLYPDIDDTLHRYFFGWLLTDKDIDETVQNLGESYQNLAYVIKFIHYGFLRNYGVTEREGEDKMIGKFINRYPQRLLTGYYRERLVIRLFINESPGNKTYEAIEALINESHLFIKYTDIRDNITNEAFRKYLLTIKDKHVMYFVPRCFIRNLTQAYE